MISFIGFIKKEFFHIRRDPRTLLVILGIPISQMLLFGFVIRTEIQDVKIAVYDRSNDYLSSRIIERLDASSYFTIVDQLDDDDGVEAIFRRGKIKEVVVFEPGFAQKAEREGSAGIQLLVDASDPNMARLITTYTNQVIRSVEEEEFGKMQLPLQIELESRMFYNEEIRSVYMFVPGLMAMIMMLVSAIMSSVSITREKEMGTMEVLLVSPLRPVQIILGKVAPYLLVAFIDAVLIVLMATLVFQMPVAGSLGLLMLICLLFIFLSLSLGLLISTIAPTQLIAMFISMIGLMLPTLLLSGFIFPIENMPLVLQWFSALMPARWFNDIVKDIMLKGSSWLGIIKEVSILLVMSVLIVVASVKKFKVRLS